jgi:purine-cytosine permease-like protein
VTGESPLNVTVLSSWEGRVDYDPASQEIGLALVKPHVDTAETRRGYLIMFFRVSRTTPYPTADRPWSIETHGIETIVDADRHGSSRELLWVWMAANISIIAVVYGAILMTIGLNLWQGVLAAVVGSFLSYFVVGVLSVAGKWGGSPTLSLSRLPFGNKGNLGPAVVSWISLLGWEVVTAVVTAEVLLALVETIWHISTTTTTWGVIAVVLVLAILLTVGRLGHATIAIIQFHVSWILGLFTLILLPLLLERVRWQTLASAQSGSWENVLGGISIVAAAGGISWANLSADYSRHLPRNESNRSIVWWTTLGSTVPLFLLIVVGILLSNTIPNLAANPNPIAALETKLPSWMAIPYLLAAFTGLMAQMVMGLYSSGLNLLVLGVRAKRSKTVLIDGTLILLMGAYVISARQEFLGLFTSFIELLACGIATWAAVFIVDMAIHYKYHKPELQQLYCAQQPFPRKELNLSAVCAWAAGVIVSLLFTSTPVFTGFLANGIFAHTNLGYFIGSVVSAAIYAVAMIRKAQLPTAIRNQLSAELSD